MVEDVVIKPKPTRLSLSKVTPRSKKLSKEVLIIYTKVKLIITQYC